MDLTLIYRVIAGIICLIALGSLVKEKSLGRAMSIGILSIPFLLRTLMLK